MTIFQIIASLFAIFMMYVVSIHQKKLKLSMLEASFWYSLWVLFIIICLFPDLLLGVTGILHFARVFDLLVVLALMVITFLVVFTYFKQRKFEAKLENWVREEAIRTATERTTTEEGHSEVSSQTLSAAPQRRKK